MNVDGVVDDSKLTQSITAHLVRKNANLLQEAILFCLNLENKITIFPFYL